MRAADSENLLRISPITRFVSFRNVLRKCQRNSAPPAIQVRQRYCAKNPGNINFGSENSIKSFSDFFIHLDVYGTNYGSTKDFINSVIRISTFIHEVRAPNVILSFSIKIEINNSTACGASMFTVMRLVMSFYYFVNTSQNPICLIKFHFSLLFALWLTRLFSFMY